MTPALQLLWALRARGVRLWVEDGQLQYDAPRGAITAQDRAQVPAVKVDLLRLLTEPCVCAPCTEGKEPHVTRCTCPACIDAEAAEKSDAEYEAEERLAIQEEGCTPVELEALRAAKSASADAVETGAHEQHEPGPPCHPPGPWNWTNPENAPGDVAILRVIERLDREESREAEEPYCYGCGGRDRWRARIGGHLVCRRCHPPAPGAEATP